MPTIASINGTDTVANHRRQNHAIQPHPITPLTPLAMGLPGHAGNVTNSGSRTLNEAWIFDPASGTLAPLTAPASNPHAAIVVVSPDGNRVAYAQPLQAAAVKAGKRSAEVVVADSDGAKRARVFALPPPDGVSGNTSASNGELEEIHDVTWARDSSHLLVVLRLVGVAGGPPSASRSRVLLVDAVPGDAQQSPPIELLRLPAEIVAGSYTWAPDGNWVAFLTKAASGNASTEFTALCALDISAAGDVSAFRYIADLGKQADSAGILPVADLAWSSARDGRLLYRVLGSNGTKTRSKPRGPLGQSPLTDRAAMFSAGERPPRPAVEDVCERARTVLVV